MTCEAQTLGFGITYDMVAARTACGQLLSLTSHRPDHDIPPHRHTNDYLCIVLTGGFAEQERAAWHERRAGSIFTHRAGETHHDRFGPAGAICVNLHFDAGEPAPDVQSVCSASLKVASEKLAFELATSSREELVLASLAAEIMGDLRRPTSQRSDRCQWIDRLVQAISDDAARRWTLAELAAIAGRHPVHVAQSFRATTGMSLGAFQRMRRLTSLSLALRTRETPLAELAVEFGYCDQSHMTTEFGSAFGVSPGRYRSEFH
jgi:AraC family transcriptional regulator